jgi:hypothetical protein
LQVGVLKQTEEEAQVRLAGVVAAEEGEQPAVNLFR